MKGPLGLACVYWETLPCDTTLSAEAPHPFHSISACLLHGSPPLPLSGRQLGDLAGKFWQALAVSHVFPTRIESSLRAGACLLLLGPSREGNPANGVIYLWPLKTPDSQVTMMYCSRGALTKHWKLIEDSTLFFLTSGEQKSEIRCWQDHVPFEGSRGGFFFPFS